MAKPKVVPLPKEVSGHFVKIVGIPANSSAAGEVGSIAFDGRWLYICVGPYVWRRAALNEF